MSKKTACDLVEKVKVPHESVRPFDTRVMDKLFGVVLSRNRYRATIRSVKLLTRRKGLLIFLMLWLPVGQVLAFSVPVCVLPMSVMDHVTHKALDPGEPGR